MKPKKCDSTALIAMLVNPKSNQRIVGLVTYIILTAIALWMTAVNILTDKGWLTVATAVFAVLCLCNIFLAWKGSEKGVSLASAVFSVELIALFTFFLISGNPEGFSAIWICMVPPIGMLFYNLKKGSLFCLVMFTELIWFLWIPAGRAALQFEYTAVFMMRFPMLFLAFFALAFFLQLLRVLTWRELERINLRNEEQAVHDQLTHLYNRQGIFNLLQKKFTESHDTFGVIIFDIDHFKRVNDAYGHMAGDAVIIKFASIIKESLSADVCRWGGEEFAAFFFDGSVTLEDLQDLLRKVSQTDFVWEGISIHLTCSAGVCEASKIVPDNFNRMIQLADKMLYTSKEKGRNCMNYSNYNSDQPESAGAVYND